MGVIISYLVEFPALGVKVSNDAVSGGLQVDAEITVTYALGEAGTFEIHLKDLPMAAHRQLVAALAGAGTGVDGGVKVSVRLGYLDAPGARRTVLTGRVVKLTSSTRYPPLGITLSGFEEAAYKLLATVAVNVEKDVTRTARIMLRKITPTRAAERVAAAAGVELTGPPDDEEELASINSEDRHAFGLLRRLADTYGAELLVQEGAVQFGKAVSYPPESGLPSVPDPSALLALFTAEDTLVAVKGMTSARLAEFRPAHLGPVSPFGVESDLPTGDVSAFDFTVLGVPDLRAGQLVAASVQGYQNPLEGFRITQLTHKLARDTGYVCTGRAMAFTKATASPAGTGSAKDGNRRATAKARRGTPQAVAAAITGRIRDELALTPSVDVGQVRTADPAARTASLGYGQSGDRQVVSPSVDLPVPDDDRLLPDKPLAAPFAWHRVGLSVPVYAGMRALLNDVRDVRDDTLVTGFLWANDSEGRMDRPKAHSGDWWLCLPTELSSGPTPRPTGKGVNDLTAADGRRVVEAVGLKVSVGKDVCSQVGDRPDEGAADEFLLRHESGTEVRIDAGGNVSVTAADNGKVTVTSGGSGEVTVNAGSGGKVAVSAGGAELTLGEQKATVSAGGVTLTVGDRKVAIS